MREFALIVLAALVALLIWTHVGHGAPVKPIGTLPAMKVVKASHEYAAKRFGVKATCQSFLTTNGFLVEVCAPAKGKAPAAKAPATKPHSSTSSHFSA